MANNVFTGYDQKLGVGVSDDLYLQHDGTNSYLINETGILSILNQSNGSNTVFKCDTAGGSTLTLLELDPDLNDGGMYLIKSQIFIKEQGGNLFFDSYLGDMYFRNLNNGGNLQFKAFNSSASLKSLFNLDPDKITAEVFGLEITEGICSSDTDSFNVQGLTAININTASGNVTLGGLSNGVAGQIIWVYKSSSLNTATIEHLEGGGSQDILTADTNDISLTNFGGVTLYFNGSYWYEIGH